MPAVPTFQFAVVWTAHVAMLHCAIQSQVVQAFWANTSERDGVTSPPLHVALCQPCQPFSFALVGSAHLTCLNVPAGAWGALSWLRKRAGN